MILAHLQKLPNNVGDLGKIILATIFKRLPKVQKIAQSGHTGAESLGIETTSCLWHNYANLKKCHYLFVAFIVMQTGGGQGAV